MRTRSLRLPVHVLDGNEETHLRSVGDFKHLINVVVAHAHTMVASLRSDHEAQTRACLPAGVLANEKGEKELNSVTAR